MEPIRIGLNAAGLDRSPDTITQFCTTNNVDMILLTET